MDVKEAIDPMRTKSRDADEVGKHEADGCNKRRLDSIARAQRPRAIRAARREGPHAPLLRSRTQLVHTWTTPVLFPVSTSFLSSS